MDPDPLVVVAANRFGVGFAVGDDVVAVAIGLAIGDDVVAVDVVAVAIRLAVGDDVVAAAIVSFGLICNFLLNPSVLVG